MQIVEPVWLKTTLPEHL